MKSVCMQRERISDAFGRLTNARDNEDRDQVDALEEDKNVELSEVAFPDAVVHPRAVVIVSVDTDLAEGAVAASRCTNDLAVWAKTTGLESVE